MNDSTPGAELIGGREKRAIELVEHDPAWFEKFERHARIIRNALGGAAIQIEHIGSTSVPGLAAKPIVDMLLVVTDSSAEAAYVQHLESAGYVLRVREPDWRQHRMFRTPERDVHLHVYSAGCPEIQRILLFRERLRSNAADRKRYERAKRDLAALDWPDMNAYADAKTEVIEQIIATALAGQR
jgi:GrpB-like predicted nucleotidyltransferase (UPF0157 family)